MGRVRLALVFGDLMMAPPPGNKQTLVYRQASPVRDDRNYGRLAAQRRGDLHARPVAKLDGVAATVSSRPARRRRAARTAWPGVTGILTPSR